MVWGGISIKGVIASHSLKTVLDDSYYVQILQDYLTPNARRQFGRRRRLQQDNDSEHKSQLTQQFLSSEVADVIDWP